MDSASAPPTEAPYIREQFRDAHDIRAGEDPDAVIARVITAYSKRLIPPNELAVSKASLCELLGVNETSFNGWKQANVGMGTPPPARWYTARGRPGSPILWSFERDILPWFASKPEGQATLRRMVEEIQAGDLYPDFEREPGKQSKILRGYLKEPAPEVPAGRPGRKPNAKLSAARVALAEGGSRVAALDAIANA